MRCPPIPIRFLWGKPMEWTDILTAVVAVYAAALSTYVMVRSRAEKKRAIRVKLTKA